MAALQAELRAMAGRQMARERADHTLQPTALVNEAYLRLLQQENIKHVSRAQFLAAAATTMRRILIEHARQRNADKHGGKRERVSITDIDPAGKDQLLDVLWLDEALQKLAAESKRICDVVVCRYFSGMTVEEVAEAMGIAPRTVAGDWAYAKAWLRRELTR